VCVAMVSRGASGGRPFRWGLAESAGDLTGSIVLVLGSAHSPTARRLVEPVGQVADQLRAGTGQRNSAISDDVVIVRVIVLLARIVRKRCHNEGAFGARHWTDNSVIVRPRDTRSHYSDWLSGCASPIVVSLLAS